MRNLLAALALLPLVGCANQLAPSIEALAKDGATSCTNLQTPYGALRVARTNPPAGQTVKVTCTTDGMIVDATK